ncbi:peptide chain release factor N(5)-glutamine methyltransferase [Candidatus Dependentiae bacterium]|nr:peptide chain release factor N(5)-glutamine methyltransferase [Candidatus Dependentiae bacterium]
MKVTITNFIKNLSEQLFTVCSTKKEATQQAWWMLEELTTKKKAQLLVYKEIELTKEQQKKMNLWIQQRIKKQKPIQYIFGHITFCNLEIAVESPILIPRPETEEWCYWLIKKFKSLKNQKFNILDLGTGSGCIALALAKNLPNSIIIGTDINPQAIKLAEKNKRLNKIQNAYFIQSDFYKNIDFELKNKRLHIDKFDLIVSNPPYISKDEWENLEDVIKFWEDKKALVTNKDGLAAYEKIITNAKSYLKFNEILNKNRIPQIILELGKNQENQVKKMLKKQNFINIKIYKDLNGKNRWISAFF